MEHPLLSIVIANYNYGRFLESAILSVITQEMFEYVELIIIDGGSTDNSVEVISKYKKYIYWWCSESDNGQSDAFNKGFSHARGVFLTWLNADDVMLPGALKVLFHNIKTYCNEDWFVGGCCYLSEDLRVLKCIPSRPFSSIRAAMGEIQVFGPSSFFSRKLFNDVGGYIDTRFHYLMDIELWNRFYRIGKKKYKRIHGYIWGFRFQQESKTAGRFLNSEKNDKDESKIKMMQENAFNKHLYNVTKTRLLRYITPAIWAHIKTFLDTKKYKGLLYNELNQISDN